MSIPQNKDCIRRNMLKQRNNVPTQTKICASQQICATILRLPCYQQAHQVAFYAAIKGEIDLSSLWQPFPQDKTCYLPALSSQQTLLFLPFNTKTTFAPNQWGISEPSSSLEEAVRIDLLEIIFIPVVAFDLQGARIGMGGGYYDRALSSIDHSSSKAHRAEAYQPPLIPYHQPLRIGVAYEFQKQSHISTDPWDQPLDAVITETNTYWFSNSDLL